MTAIGIMLVILLVAALMTLLFVAMFIIVSTIDKESWENNDMGKGCDDDKED